MLRWLGWGTLLVACAAPVQQKAPPVRYVPKPVVARPVAETPSIAEREHKADQKVAVRGLEGSLSNYDVKDTMERRSAEFGACHEPRARRVPRLAGNIEFGIRVSEEGAVQQVDVRNSDVGDRTLERCFVQVITNTPFPRPHGGEAKVTWSMILGPARSGKDPEQWEITRIERVLEKKTPELLESCSLPPAPPYLVTAYVNRRGRVVTAGVSAAQGGDPEHMDCIAHELRSWRMPSPRKSPLAKVSFPLTRDPT